MKKLPLLIGSLLFIVTLASCEFDVATETTVYPDGSLDKTIAIEKKDSSRLFNVNTWNRSVKHINKIVANDSGHMISKSESKTFDEFHKKFSSADEANAELSVSSDTLLQVTTRFDKKFRWFYTYITYSETYHKLNKMKLDQEDFFTTEDYAFIDRLPAEGQKISTADELYLKLLHDKIFDAYGEKALYDEWFELALLVVNTQPGIDSLKRHAKDFREALDKFDEQKIDADRLLLVTIDSFNIPIDRSKLSVFEVSQQKFWKKVSFISSASDGKFVNRINLPWPVVSSNADSVVDNSLVWTPPTIKFLLKDYTMYGECRKLNWWAVIVSVLIVGFTGYLLVRKKN